jgi:hypothetical protein
MGGAPGDDGNGVGVSANLLGAPDDLGWSMRFGQR